MINTITIMHEHTVQPNLESFVVHSDMCIHVKTAKSIDAALLWIHLLRPYWQHETFLLLRSMALSVHTYSTDILFPDSVKSVLLSLTNDVAAKVDEATPMTLQALQNLPFQTTENLDPQQCAVLMKEVSRVISETNNYHMRHERIAGVYRIFLHLLTMLKLVKEKTKLQETVLRKIDEIMLDTDELHDICLFVQHKLVDFAKLNAVQRLRFYLERKFIYNV